MPSEKKGIVAIAMLLRQPRVLDLDVVRRAAEFAFRGAPEPPRVKPISDLSAFGIALGSLRLGLINRSQPYFKDIAKAADRVMDTAGRIAIQNHTAWISIDLMGNPPPIDLNMLYGLIGCLLAEFLNDDVLGLIRLPEGPVIGYDYSFIPMFRSRKASDVFSRGTPDRTISGRGREDALAAATAESQRRWPEFVAAFASRYQGQGFAVKTIFFDDSNIEHMWVTVTNIIGKTVHGWLSNEPRQVKQPKFRDQVQVNVEDIEDWMYTNGKENVGGFQVKVLKEN